MEWTQRKLDDAMFDLMRTPIMKQVLEKIFPGGGPGVEFPLLWVELSRIEQLAREETGVDSTFTDGRAGCILWNLTGLRAGVFSARKVGSGHSVLFLRFNASIVRRVGEEAFLPTVAHEYAHAVVYAFRLGPGRGKGLDYRPHGALWTSLMELFGHTPERCHNYPAAPARARRTFPYRCGTCHKEYRLGSIRHHRLLKNPGYLHCGSCRGALVHDSGTG